MTDSCHLSYFLKYFRFIPPSLLPEIQNYRVTVKVHTEKCVSVSHQMKRNTIVFHSKENYKKLFCEYVHKAF